MNHRDLWNDTLDDALPPDASAMVVPAMCRAARRAHWSRRAAQVAVSLGCAALAALLLVREQGPVPATPASQPNFAEGTSHVLTDAELLDRLQDAGFGIIITGSPDHRQLLLVSSDGSITEP